MNLVEIPIGFDPFHAQVIVDYGRDSEIESELLLFDETRYELGRSVRVQNRLLVDATDEAAARQVLADLYPDLAEPGTTPGVEVPPMATLRLLGRLAFTAVAIGLVGIGLVGIGLFTAMWMLG